MKVFGLIPEDHDLEPSFLELLTSQVAGYYVPQKDELFIVEGASKASLEEGADEAHLQRLEEGTWVHEIVHFLQDQQFGLRDWASPDFLDDAGLAWQALVEGDAEQIRTSFLMGLKVETLPSARKRNLAESANSPAMVLSQPSLAAEVLQRTPPFLVDATHFPYTGGLLFANALRRAGGNALVDYAFRHDRPVSSEQILHPEKWLEDRDGPVLIDLSSSAQATGRTPALEGSLGEWGIRQLLGTRLGDPREAVETASDGWGGDRFVYFAPGDRQPEALAWVVEWDTPADSREFLERIEAALPGWEVAKAGKTRVMAVFAPEAGRKTRKALRQLAKNASATRATGTAPDLLALGIEYEPEPFSFSGLLRRLRDDPVLPSLIVSFSGGKLTEESLLEFAEITETNPEFLAVVDDLLAGGSDLSLEEALQSEEATASLVVDDVTIQDGRLSIDSLGFSMRLPDSEAWQPLPYQMAAAMPVSPALALFHENPRAIFMILAMGMPGAAATQAGLDQVWTRLGTTHVAEGLEVEESFDELSDHYALRSAHLVAGQGDVAMAQDLYVVRGHIVALQLFHPAGGSAKALRPVLDTWSTVRIEPPGEGETRQDEPEADEPEVGEAQGTRTERKTPAEGAPAS